MMQIATIVNLGSTEYNKDLESEIIASPKINDVIFDNQMLLFELERVETENRELK